jgi:hypothetical protein
MPLAPYGPPRLVADGLLVAGDATGFMDPITGEGMYKALSGSAIAAEVLDAALGGGEGPVSAAALAPYEARLRARFGPVVRFVETAVRVTTWPVPATGAFVRVVGAWPALGRAVAATQGAVLDPASLLRPWRWPGVSPSPLRGEDTGGRLSGGEARGEGSRGTPMDPRITLHPPGTPLLPAPEGAGCPPPKGGGGVPTPHGPEVSS